jgi:hypothetical protein
MTKIEGTVERCAPAYGEKGMLGMYFLLVGSPIVYTAQESFRVYGDAHGRPSRWNASLINLTSPGDEISFEIAQDYPRFGEPRTLIATQSFRNWTLEQRLLGVEKDVSQRPTEPPALGAPPKLLGAADGSQ